MKTRDDTVRAAVPPFEIRPAHILVCEVCNGETWICFVLDGDAHAHFQCAQCATSYCPDGLCGTA